jgi:predicted nucleic acid-binding protein
MMQNEASEPVTLDRVLDAYALVAFLEGEAGATQVENLIQQALRGEVRLAMTVVNLGEVYYSVWRKKSLEVAEAILENLLGLPIEFVTVDWNLARQAAEFKAKGGIAYADCFGAALAYQRGLPLVTGDPEFHRLEDLLPIEWI